MYTVRLLPRHEKVRDRFSSTKVRLDSMKNYQMYIGGEFTAGSTTKAMDVVNPATGEVFAQVPEANRQDMQRAIAAAREAFDKGDWRSSTGIQRANVLFKIAAAL